MVLVLRGELRLTAGKAAVQASHAAVMLTLAAQARHPGALTEWLREGQKKIALVIPTLSEMEQLDRGARSKGIPTVWVEDAGLTEVPARHSDLSRARPRPRFAAGRDHGRPPTSLMVPSSSRARFSIYTGVALFQPS